MGTRKPSKTAGSGGIWCPFYLAQSDREIHCEGITEDCRLILRFNTHNDLLLQRAIFCEAAHRNCEIYRMLMIEKYGEELPR